MSGCCTRDYDKFFSGKQAALDVRRFKMRGLRGSAAALARLAGDVRGATILEVGGGVGAIEIVLLEAGATHATSVELSSAYEAAANDLLAERGLDGRVDRRVADFVTDAAAIEPHDVVVMHRVVCCYPDVDALVGSAADRTQHRLLLTYPQERALTRLGVRVVNAFLKLSGSTFRAYVHSVARIDAAATRRGLAVAEHERRGLLWESVAFARS